MKMALLNHKLARGMDRGCCFFYFFMQPAVVTDVILDTCMTLRTNNNLQNGQRLITQFDSNCCVNGFFREVLESINFFLYLRLIF